MNIRYRFWKLSAYHTTNSASSQNTIDKKSKIKLGYEKTKILFFIGIFYLNLKYIWFFPVLPNLLINAVRKFTKCIGNCKSFIKICTGKKN